MHCVRMSTGDLDLDAKGFDVLEAIYELNGEATTSEVKEYTGIEKNAIIHYRFDKLEEQGLVTMSVAEEMADGNRMPPKKAVLTERAGERIADGLFSDEEPTIVERMDRLERRFSAVVEEMHTLSDEFRRWRYDEERDEEVDITDLMEKAERLDTMLEGVDEDDLGGILDLEHRVDRLEAAEEPDADTQLYEEGLAVKGKWLSLVDSLPDGGRGVHTMTGLDIIEAFRVLDRDLQRLSEAVEDSTGVTEDRNGDPLPHRQRSTPSAAPVAERVEDVEADVKD